VEADVGDLSDIFDIFSNDDEENNRTRKQTGSQDEPSRSDLKTVVMNKLAKNKALLVATVVAGIAIVGMVTFFLIKYIGTNGTKGIAEGITPFLN
jgi:hypothetical protein